MKAFANPAKTRERLERQLRGIYALRGSGPNPFDYDLWQSRTHEVLRALYGPDSPELRRYEAAVLTRGRLPGVRGLEENMTLNIHGPWGILARLERAEQVLRDLIAALPSSESDQA